MKDILEQGLATPTLSFLENGSNERVFHTKGLLSSVHPSSYPVPTVSTALYKMVLSREPLNKGFS